MSTRSLRNILLRHAARPDQQDSQQRGFKAANEAMGFLKRHGLGSDLSPTSSSGTLVRNQIVGTIYSNDRMHSVRVLINSNVENGQKFSFEISEVRGLKDLGELGVFVNTLNKVFRSTDFQAILNQ